MRRGRRSGSTRRAGAASSSSRCCLATVATRCWTPSASRPRPRSWSSAVSTACRRRRCWPVGSARNTIAACASRSGTADGAPARRVPQTAPPTARWRFRSVSGAGTWRECARATAARSRSTAKSVSRHPTPSGSACTTPPPGRSTTCAGSVAPTRRCSTARTAASSAAGAATTRRTCWTRLPATPTPASRASASPRTRSMRCLRMCVGGQRAAHPAPAVTHRPPPAPQQTKQERELRGVQQHLLKRRAEGKQEELMNAVVTVQVREQPRGAPRLVPAPGPDACAVSASGEATAGAREVVASCRRVASSASASGGP